MNCQNLNELSLNFPIQNNDSTDLVALMDSLGRTCPNLRNMHISSIRLCNEAVFALESANLRYLSVHHILPWSLWNVFQTMLHGIFAMNPLYLDLNSMFNLLCFSFHQGPVHAVLSTGFKNNRCSCCIYCSFLCKLGAAWFKWVSTNLMRIRCFYEQTLVFVPLESYMETVP